MINVKLNNNVKVAVVGDIHEHSDQFFQLLEKVNPTEKMIFVSVGDIYDKGFGVDKAHLILDALIPLAESKIAYVVKGNHELKNISRNRKNLDKYLDWMDKCPLAISFQFENSSRLTVVHGGVTPSMTWDDLESNVKVAYIRTIDENGKMIPLIWKKDDQGNNQLVVEKEGPTWHELYDGRFGYIASGHDAQRDGIPKFYNYSCNLDSACFCTGILTCQIFGSAGREELISVTGPAKRSKG